MKNIEVEVRGLLTKLNYDNLIKFLDTNGSNKSIDNRKTVFFTLVGKTLKVSNQFSKGKAKIALKVGDIVKDISQKEFELNIEPEQYELAVDLFKNLGFNKLQYTEQKRINYNFKDVEIAVKWSKDWGHHFEIDKVISENENDIETKKYLESLAQELGLSLMSEEEFGRKCEEIDRKYNPTTEPLYIQAKNKVLGSLQIMDQETLDWIKNESPSFLEHVSKEYTLLELSEVPKITLEQFELVKLLVPKVENFYSPNHYCSIHGISHIIRVMYITTLVCNLIGEKDFFNELLVTASIHDIRRINDNEDKGHGGRAYKWFKNNLDQHGNLFELSKNSLQIIKQATVFHQIDYKDIPTEICQKYSYYIDVFKSADALDRFRQPKSKWWPNPNYINLKETIKLLKICNQFTILTEQAILDEHNRETPAITIHKIAKQLFLNT